MEMAAGSRAFPPSMQRPGDRFRKHQQRSNTIRKPSPGAWKWADWLTLACVFVCDTQPEGRNGKHWDGNYRQIGPRWSRPNDLKEEHGRFMAAGSMVCDWPATTSQSTLKWPTWHPILVWNDMSNKSVSVALGLRSSCRQSSHWPAGVDSSVAGRGWACGQDSARRCRLETKSNCSAITTGRLAGNQTGPQHLTQYHNLPVLLILSLYISMTAVYISPSTGSSTLTSASSGEETRTTRP